ncbi:hypothetical protein BPAE_0150g00050 [Botrytis paeoniae]|uniref:Uncharacterized protein n=1 Tax=Botrytis paeoniae TaxID=278948 RepID=A0A4Z1FJF2_9HELO|nr:hypothetical protein BPAE_0150g00050 [Botrytis paeoniae]
MAFLRFICETGKIRAFSSAHQYLLQFKQFYNRANGHHMDTNDTKEVLMYLRTTLADRFNLERTTKAKPVLGADDILLLLTHHWARDTSTFPTENQRLALATIMLLSIYTGCRPAELVDASKGKAVLCGKLSRNDSTCLSNDGDSDDEDFKDSEDERSFIESKELDDPNYNQQNPWSNLNNIDYKDDIEDDEIETRRFKSLCYEDIRLWIVQNPTKGERDLLGMEVTFAHRKGVDRKPKPTTFIFHEETLPILCPIAHILAIAIRDDAIKVDGYRRAEPFFESNLQDPTKAVLVHWKPHMLKTPIFR